jgi:hypothetical protein
MKERSVSGDLGFTEEKFADATHVCMIFDDEEQRRKIVAEYVAAGLEKGELVRYFVDASTPEDVRAWLMELGVRLEEGRAREAFGVFGAERAYCPDGRFEPDVMLAAIASNYEKARAAGYSASRSCGEMGWVLKGLPGSERLLEYEAKLSTLRSDFPHSGMCQYDARLFDGATLFKVLKVHPYMVAQGQVVRNPYYVRPEEYLATAR